MAAACLQGVEHDLCMGPLMTPRERGSLTWPELSQDLSHSADDPPQGGIWGTSGTLYISSFSPVACFPCWDVHFSLIMVGTLIGFWKE